MITVKICSGTVCHVMGGADLHFFTEFLPEHLKEQVSVSGVPCIGACNKDDRMKPPFVMVNNILIAEATFAKIVETVKTQLP